MWSMVCRTGNEINFTGPRIYNFIGLPRSKPKKMHATPSASSQNLAANSRDRSGSAAVSGDGSLLAELPWGAVKVIGPSIVDPSVQPGEYAAKTLFVDFVMTSERKIQAVLQESLVSGKEAKAMCLR